MRLVKKAEYLSGYEILVTFDNEEVKLCDVSKWNKFKGIFEELKDISKFKLFYVEDGILKWSEQQDICPDKMYKEGECYVN